MALPALRQPKFMTKQQENSRKRDISDVSYVILTLKNEMKFVVTSDAYNGIVAEDRTYRCVFCENSMQVDSKCKELHKESLDHKIKMIEVPYIEEFCEHLVRKLNKDQSYCTICNVVLPTYSTTRHIINEGHAFEVSRARTRALTYKPSE